MERIRSIQALRAFAAVSVVQLHVLDAQGYLLGLDKPPAWDVGHVGVDVFFVISGFIMARLAMSAPSATDFLVRRFLRVAPFYWLLTLPWVGIALWKGQLTWQSGVASLAFWPVLKSEPSLPILYIGWTLCFEAVFYVAAASAQATGRLGAAGVCCAWTAAFVAFLAGSRGISAFLGNPLMLEFGVGVLVALRPVRPRPRLGVLALAAAAVALLAFGLHSLGPLFGVDKAYWAPAAVIRVALLGPVALAIFWGGLQLDPWITAKWGAVIQFGDASFALYLIHPLALAGLLFIWPARLSPLLFVAACFIVCLAAGVAVHRLIEQPLLSWLRGFLTVSRQPIAIQTIMPVYIPAMMRGQAKDAQ